MQPANLIIFDIDGTLTQTNSVDTEIFADVIMQYLKIDKLNTDWNQYKYSTDSGILLEIFKQHLQREPEPAEVHQIQEQFYNALQTKFNDDHYLFAPLPGATEIFSFINKFECWHIGIATGGWYKTALFKLNAANIQHQAIPKATADDHIERSKIIERAISRCQAFYNVRNFSRIIYVGDRAWDQTAAAKLKLEFIGIGPAFATEQNQLNDYTGCNLKKLENILTQV